jgi:hypothetical protein
MGSVLMPHSSSSVKSAQVCLKVKDSTGERFLKIEERKKTWLRGVLRKRRAMRKMSGDSDKEAGGPVAML